MAGIKIKLTKNVEEADVITHGGVFHADDCMATAIYAKYFQEKNPEATELLINRAFNPAVLKSAKEDAVVLDFGGGEFDHHQKGGNGARTNGIMYSSAGLVWKKFGREMVDEKKFREIDDRLILPIDALDNGQEIRAGYSFTEYIDGFNPLWDSQVNPDEQFKTAVSECQNVLEDTLELNSEIINPSLYDLTIENHVYDLDLQESEGLYHEMSSLPYKSGMQETLSNISYDATMTLLSPFTTSPDPFRGITSQLYACSEETIKHIIDQAAKNAGEREVSKTNAKDIVRDAVLSSKDGIIKFSQFAPWQNNLFELESDPSLAEKAKEAAFVIFPSNRGGYNVQCIPPEPGSFEQRIPLPKQWRGLRGEELQETSGVSDAIFCHPAGFICAAESLESAIQMAETTREMTFTKAIAEMETMEDQIRESYRKTFGFESAAEDRAVENMKISIMDSIPGLESYIEDMDTQQSELEELENMATQEMKIPDLPELETEEELEW